MSTGYAVYVCGFAFATLVVRSAPGLAWFVCIVCSIVGGVAGGVLWTSQGLYFSRHAYLYVLLLLLLLTLVLATTSNGFNGFNRIGLNTISCGVRYPKTVSSRPALY